MDTKHEEDAHDSLDVQVNETDEVREGRAVVLVEYFSDFHLLRYAPVIYGTD